MFGLLPKNLEFYDCFDRAVDNAVRAVPSCSWSAPRQPTEGDTSLSLRLWMRSTPEIASRTKRSIDWNRRTLRPSIEKTSTA